MDRQRRRFILEAGLLVAAASSPVLAAPAARRKNLRRVERVLAGMPTKDGAGVALTRVIGQPALRNLDPFIMLDRFHSDEAGAYIRGFPDHPHRGFETVTVMLAGNMRHRDSRGNSGLITGGGSQWMTAGRGLIHSEMPEQREGLMSGFQLWVNLPAAEKMCVPHYQDLQPAALAQGSISNGGSTARVISGNVDGLKGPVRPRPTDPTLLMAFLEDDQPFELRTPEAHTAFLFVGQGEVAVGPEPSTTVSEGLLAILTPGTHLAVRATNRRSEVLLAAGRPLREPIVQRGPFVMNTEAEIQRAYADYRAGVLDQG